MRCSEVLEELCGYLDGEARPAGRHAEVEDHVNHCPTCDTLVSGCRETIQIYRRAPAPPLPREMRQRLMERVQRLPAR